jgi:predicted MPP superfamily phosphohydrolase
MKNRLLARLSGGGITRSKPRLRLRWQEHFSALLQAAILEPRTLEVTHLRLSLPKLPAEFHGFRLIQLSDIHHSPFLSEQEIAAAADHANTLDPDLIVLTGDYVSHSRDFITGCARALGRLKAKHGVLAVLGNHDHWTDGAAMAQALRVEGIEVLANENLIVKRESASIRLLGVDDSTVRRDDLQRALAGTTRDETRILLAHNPAIIREAARAGIDLVLSGHTHGGQINWRLLTGREDGRTYRWLRRPSRRLMRGYARLGETHLYVNRGLGTVVLPLRYGCPPEISVIELSRH